jgi:hypothetical protein
MTTSQRWFVYSPLKRDERRTCARLWERGSGKDSHDGRDDAAVFGGQARMCARYSPGARLLRLAAPPILPIRL